MNESQFRQRLDEITTDRDSSLWLPDIGNLRAVYPHTIEVAEVGLNRGFNCFAFAFGLVASNAYFTVASRSVAPNIHASSLFVRWLLDRGELQSSHESAGESVVVYFAGSEPTHAGRGSGTRVVSKWGTGFWFNHEVFEVPLSYGSRVEYFVPPSSSNMEAAFLRFASSEGVPVQRFVPNWNGAA